MVESTHLESMCFLGSTIRDAISSLQGQVSLAAFQALHVGKAPLFRQVHSTGYDMLLDATSWKVCFTLKHVVHSLGMA